MWPVRLHRVRSLCDAVPPRIYTSPSAFPRFQRVMGVYRSGCAMYFCASHRTALQSVDEIKGDFDGRR